MKASDIFTFGKYKGKKLKDITRNDPSYVQWCINNVKGFTVTPSILKTIENMSEGVWNDMKEKDYELGY